MIRARLDLRDPAGPDRLLDLVDRRVAHGLPAIEALAQAQEGDVAVAVVRRLLQHGQDQLADRVAVRRHDGHRRRPPRGACGWRARGGHVGAHSDRLRPALGHARRRDDALGQRVRQDRRVEPRGGQARQQRAADTSPAPVVSTGRAGTPGTSSVPPRRAAAPRRARASRRQPRRPCRSARRRPPRGPRARSARWPRRGCT